MWSLPGTAGTKTRGDCGLCLVTSRVLASQELGAEQRSLGQVLAKHISVSRKSCLTIQHDQYQLQPHSQARGFFGYTKESHRAWYLKSRDRLMSLSDSKDGCVSLRFTGDFVSAVSLWHKRVVKISYK